MSGELLRLPTVNQYGLAEGAVELNGVIVHPVQERFSLMQRLGDRILGMAETVVVAVEDFLNTNGGNIHGRF